MVSLESIAMTPELTTGCPDEHDVAHQKKLAKLRGTTTPSVLSKRLSRKVTMETEGTSTTDTEGTDAEESTSNSDALSDALELECQDRKVVPAIDIENTPVCSPVCGGTGAFASFMSPDPFDFMPSVRARPAFSERNYPQMQTGPTDTLPWQNQNQLYSTNGGAPAMQPMAQAAHPMSMAPLQPMAPQQTQPMVMQQTMMPAMQPPVPAHVAPEAPMTSWAKNPSPGQMMVPVPMPVQMPSFMMQTVGSQSVPVPPGFKLVRIPEKMSEKISEKVPQNASEATKSAISDPTNTERKIFVGGLNPSTTGQTLREYFSKFGPVMDAKVIREGEKSKGFGFVQFKESIPAEVLEQSHIIDQRRCGVGRAFHREGAQ